GAAISNEPGETRDPGNPGWAPYTARVVAGIGAPRLFGRDAELARIRGVLDAVADGAQALVLQGEPGIGKTSLWAWGVAQARSRGAVVLSARPAEAESALPFVVLGDLLGAVSDELLAQLPFPQRHALEAVLLRREPEKDVERLALSVGVLAIVRSMARDAPLGVAVDDLQWTDAPSRAILAFALRRLVEEPVMLIATTRRDDDELFGELSTNRVVRIEVAPLDDDAPAARVRAQATSRRTRAAVRAVLERAGGNPFFALELARAQGERRAANLALPAPPRAQPRPPHFPLPRSLESLVSQRLERVPARAREVLLAASILRRPSRRLLAGVAGAGTRGGGGGG